MSRSMVLLRECMGYVEAFRVRPEHGPDVAVLMVMGGMGTCGVVVWWCGAGVRRAETGVRVKS